jgi:hypothetical protein
VPKKECHIEPKQKCHQTCEQVYWCKVCNE